MRPKESDFQLTKRQLAMKKQMGVSAWAGQLREARRRERVVLAYLRFVERGFTPAEAAARAGAWVKLATIKIWVSRYARRGQQGLIFCGGRIQRLGHLDPALQKPKAKRTTQRALSFIKWAGSKQRVLEDLLSKLPVTVGAYYEPMVGSGALFVALNPRSAVLGDANAELMECYVQLRDNLGGVVKALARHRNTSAHFHKVRAQDVTRLGSAARAARFIYLTKTCFNGLYRVNQAGRFNVPYGRIANANICDQPALEKMATKLQGVKLRTGDFSDTCREAPKGALVYFDPPYLTRVRGRAIRYGTTPFDYHQHVRLAACARELAARGCWVMVSNSDLPEVRKLYRGFTLERLTVTRRINANAKERHGFTELLIHNIPKTKGRGKAKAQAAIRQARAALP